MKIAVDARALLGGKRTGIEEYAINILENLFKKDSENEYILFLNSFSEPKIDLEWAVKLPNVTVKHFRYPNRLLNLFFWYFNWPKIDKMIGGVDIFFMPNIDFAPVSRDAKLVLTMHDLSFYYYSETFSWKRRLWHFFVNPRKLAKRADKVIAISQSTKEDIMKIYGVSQSKVEVIHNGVSDNFKQIDRNDYRLLKIKEKYNLPFKFIFYLGTIEPRKNIIAIVRAYNQFRNLQDYRLNHKLVIAGVKGWKFGKIFKEINNSPYKEDIILTGYVKSKDKVFVYNLASVFVYPSFFEGFGFPVLEAMKCGIPVISSNTSSMPEIVNGAGIMVNPDEPDEIFYALQEILLKKDFKEKFRKKGLRQSIKFSWKNSSYKLWNCFNLLK